VADPRLYGGILYLRSNRILSNFPSTGNLFLLSSGVVRALRGALHSLDLLENGIDMGRSHHTPPQVPQAPSLVERSLRHDFTRMCA
jgi:hypothetical protein